MYDPDIPELESYKHICTECYELGSHGEVTYGNWQQYSWQAAVIGTIILIPSLIYLCWIFVLYTVSTVFNKGLPDAHALIDPFPLRQYMPQKPHTVLVCPHCKKVNTQAKITNHDGQTALHFHKKNGLHMRKDRTVTIPTSKTDHEQF